MKKLGLLLALVVICAGIGLAQTTIFSDDMTSFPTGWTLSPTTGWTKSSTQYYSASYSARCDDVNPYANSQNNYMTRSVNLSGYTSATLSFYIWQYTEAGYDYVYLQYYSGTTWTTAWSRAGNYQSWAQQSATIPTTATQVRFWFKSDGSVTYQGAYIDNVVLTASGGTVTQNDAGSGGDAGNTFTAALGVSPGSWTGCYLSSTDTTDYYKFNVTSGQVIKVKITPGSGLDFDLKLFNPSQVQKASSTAGAGIADSCVFTADATGYWYAKAYYYSGTSGNYGLQITLSGGASPTLAVSMTTWSPAAAGGTSSAVNVTNSTTSDVIAYTVSSNQTWLTVSAASGNTPGSFSMTAAANSGAARTATVTVTATTGGVAGSPKTISVSQAAAATPTLAISMTSWSPAAAGGTSSAVNVTNSGSSDVIAYTVSSNQTWLTVSAASGNTPGSFTMTAAANTGAARTATVTVTATTGGVANSPQTIAVSQAAGGTTGYEWTVLVYLNADNNLEPYGISDFAEMAAASYSSGKIRVVVQMDRANGYDATNGDWKTCKRFLITSGMTPTAANQISDLGEVDMGNPQTLADFVKWGIQNYPANHYFVDIWNHGGGYSKDVYYPDPLRDFSNDETSGNGISVANGEFASAMTQIKSYLGGNLDILAWDCCLMGMWEVVDIAKDYANTAVVSEETEGGDGWYYTNFLNTMNTTPTISAIDACKAVINGTSGLDTHSAIDLTLIPALTTKVNILADELIAAKGAGLSSSISTALTNTQKFSTSYFTYFIDLSDFATKVKAQITSRPTLTTACNDVIAAVTNAVKLYKNASAYANARGLSIYHCSADGSNYDNVYNGLPVVANTHWDEYIKGGSGPVPTTNYTKSTATYSWDASATTASGCTGDDQAVTVNIGFSFNFYGTSYSTVNICSNGFINFGTSSTAYSPATIPSTAAPNAMIAGLWRDLNPSGGGTITYYSSATKFVVSYNAVKNYSNTSTQTFQVILNSDGTIKVQWGAITTDVTSSTGVEDQGGSRGVSHTAAANTAILLTPPAAWSPIIEDPQANQAVRNGRSEKPLSSLLSQNMPNPVRGKTLISYQLSQPGHASLKVYNLNGQLVRTLVNTVQDIGYYDISWNARDEAGHTVAAGVYMYKLDTPGFSGSKRMILLK